MSNAQAEFECPSCHRELVIPDEVIAKLGSSTQSRGPTTAWISTGVVAVLLVVMSVVALLKAQGLAGVRQAYITMKAQRDDAVTEAETLRKNIVRMEKEAEVALKEAQAEKRQATQEAQAVVAKAEEDAKRIRGRAEEFATMIEGRMQQVYGDLKLYRDGANPVNGRYLESFEISRGHIILNMLNCTRTAVKPKLDIHFYDRHGFVVGHTQEHWLLDMIDPGGRRVEDNTIFFSHGAVPYYYTVSE